MRACRLQELHTVLSDLTPCILVEIYGRLGGKHRLYSEIEVDEASRTCAECVNFRQTAQLGIPEDNS